MTAPILLAPSLVDPAWRTVCVSIAGTGALGLCAIGLAPHHTVRIWGWALVLAVGISWFQHQVHDLTATSHFGGITFGLLMMTVVSGASTTPRSLLTLFWLLVVGSTAVIIAGLFSISIDSVGATKFGELGAWAVAFLAQLPNVTPNLPGMGNGGQVNANALGGTAALVLSLAAGLVAASRHPNRPAQGWLLATSGIVACVAALLIISLTLSRTAMGAVVATLVIAGLRWRSTRRWVVGALIAVAAVTAFTGAPAPLPRPVERMADSLGTRLAIWRIAADRVRANPLTGVGISQFRDVAPYRIDDSSDVAHAHNIFLQTALDIGIPGLLAYISLVGTLIWRALRIPGPGAVPAVAAAAGLSLLTAHFFGLLDAIALGAKVGAIQWACAGLILGASGLRRRPD